jgi:molybdopterin/thiamine biosynthesis adenylyltransferase/rhodanese-related sulfurtransferase
VAKTYRELLTEARKQIPEITSEDLKKKLDAREEFLLIDVRDPDEWRAEGLIPTAIPISRGFLEFKIPQTVPNPETPLVLYCLSGLRSLLAATALKELGYENVTSLAGGLQRWKTLDYPLVKETALTTEQVERYSRHFMLPQVGERGQKQLLQSKVLCIGAGGLGSPTAFYLAAAGVGTLGIIDSDRVDLSNLQRQILHKTQDVGRPKVDSARETLEALNPDVKIVPYPVRLTVENIVEILQNYDVIVDGSDNFDTRYLVNDACYLLKKPNVHGSIFQFEGMVTIFNPDRGPCYRCLYPIPPPPGLVPS